MCRWFAYISPTEPCLLEDVLVTPEHSLSKQVDTQYLPGLQPPTLLPADEENTEAKRNKFLNVDGMGVAWYTAVHNEFALPTRWDDIYSLHPIMYKGLRIPFHNPEFLSLCANTATRTLFAHIRAALPSPLRPIPTVTEFNCHPFQRGRYVFMHNGGVGNYEKMVREVHELMGEEEAAWVKGNTDTEALAGVFFTLLAKETPLEDGPGPIVVPSRMVGCSMGPEIEQVLGGSASPKDSKDVSRTARMLKNVLVKTITVILLAQKKVMKGQKAEISYLNLAVTDGRVLVCCRFCNDAKEQPLSLYYSTTAGPTFNRKYAGHPCGPNRGYGDRVPHNFQDDLQILLPEKHGKHVIVASEPMTYNKEEWTLVPKNDCILVDERGRMVKEPLGIVF